MSVRAREGPSREGTRTGRIDAGPGGTRPETICPPALVDDTVSTMTNTPTINGIDTKALHDIMDAVRKRPPMARSTFRVDTELQSGFASRSATKPPTLGGAPLAGRTHTFAFEGSHPPELLGHDEGPAGVETLLAALGACVGSGFTTFGATMGIPVERVRVELAGEIDLRGFMGLPAPGVVRPGFERIHATIRVKARAPRDQLEKLKEMAEGLSPVKDSLRAVAYTSELVVES